MAVLILVLIGALGVAAFSRARVARAFDKARDVPVGGGLTGAEAARRILDREGLADVPVLERTGLLTNRYDPERRRLILAPEIFRGAHAEAVGIALHETGHALQQQAGYDAMVRRIGAVRGAQFVGGILFFAPLAAAIFRLVPWRWAIFITLGGWALLSILNLLTLGIEISASNRARRAVEDARLLGRLAETEAVEAALAAAAWMRVGEILDSPKNLLRSLVPFRKA